MLGFTVGVGPRASGIYALYFRGSLVYIGKASTGMTKSGRTLRQRLSEHQNKIAARRVLPSSSVGEESLSPNHPDTSSVWRRARTAAPKK